MLFLLHFLHMIRHQFWIERHFFNQLVFAREKNNQIMYLLQGIRVSKLYRFASCEYSRVWNRRRPMLINFWTFFQGLRFLLERLMRIIFQNILYLMVWGMPILRAMLNVFAKCSRGHVYSRGYVYSRV